MNEAVFISDLHLSPDYPDITKRFIAFCDWVSTKTNTLYILGDFFHLWLGDDAVAPWMKPIEKALLNLNHAGVAVFFMCGNRDFMLGRAFCRKTKMQYLSDPSCIQLGEQTTVLTHGDRLCTKDIKHQRFYKLTRNRVFRFIFAKIPLRWRQKLARRVRHNSQMNKPLQKSIGQVTLRGIQKLLSHHPGFVLIHGHTHQPALHHHVLADGLVKRYVLSDWDDIAIVLCYSQTKGFYFHH